MGSTSATASAKDNWGYLIAPDKSPSPPFGRLLLSIAKYIVSIQASTPDPSDQSQDEQVVPRDAPGLTPAKLAAFYRLVGGNYDPLFLDSPPSSVGFIYKSLGCFHSLQPGNDPFQSPTIPALTAQGFVRWQTVQLLLGPEEHVPYLQEAVRKLELVNPGEGGPFPKVLPAECLPAHPDRDMLRWHESVGEKLRLESEGRAKDGGASPPRSRGYGSEPSPNTRAEFRTVSDAAGYFQASPVGPGAARHHPGAAPSAPPPIHTRFKNLNFSSTYSPHVRPPHFSANSPSPTSDRSHTFPSPHRDNAPAFRHVPPSSRSRHKPANASNSSSRPSSRDRSPSPPPRRPRHHGRQRTQSPVRSAPHAATPPLPPRPHHLARPTEHMMRRHSAQAQGPARSPPPPVGRGDPHARRRSHVGAGARGPHGLSPPFYAQPGPPSRPVSQAGLSPALAGTGANGPAPAPPGSQGPPPASSQGAPLQQVRSAPLQQGPFAPSGYRYSIAGYGPAAPGAGPGSWRSREPPPSERGGGKRSSSISTRFAPDAPLRAAGEDAEGRDASRRRRADFLEERPRDQDRPGEWRRRSRDRVDDVRSR